MRNIVSTQLHARVCGGSRIDFGTTIKVMFTSLEISLFAEKGGNFHYTLPLIHLTSISTRLTAAMLYEGECNCGSVAIKVDAPDDASIVVCRCLNCQSQSSGGKSTFPLFQASPSNDSSSSCLWHRMRRSEQGLPPGVLVSDFSRLSVVCHHHRSSCPARDV